MNVANLLRLSALCFPDRPALSWGRTRLSYGEFDRRSAAFADWLVTEGGAPGGRVALVELRAVPTGSAECRVQHDVRVQVDHVGNAAAVGKTTG